MIVFCTHCWHETDSSLEKCPYCGADLALDHRSYEEKLTGALDHPLPEARVRTCWLIALNGSESAVPKLISVAESDPDLFVRRAAVQTLGKLHAESAVPLLQSLLKQNDRWMQHEANKSLQQIRGDQKKRERPGRQKLSDVKPDADHG